MAMRPRKVEVIGHAGAAGFHPHNSRDSILKAVELGVDRIEVDLLTARNDALILSHDANVLIDGALQETRALTLDQVRVVLTGLVTLEEAIELTGNSYPLLLDIKGRHLAAPLIAAIGDSPDHMRMSACGTFGRTLRDLKRRYPAMRIGLSRGHSVTKVKPPWLQPIAGAIVSLAQIPSLTVTARWFGAREVMIYHHICTRPLVMACHLARLRVNVWTVDEPADIRRVLRNGADGVISNYPDRVIEALAEAGLSRLSHGQ